MAKNATRWLVLLTLAVWAAWDAAVYLRVGGEATISTAFGRWFSLPWVGWWVLGTFGFMAGHLLGMTDRASPDFWWRAAVVPLAAAALGFWLTLRS